MTQDPEESLDEPLRVLVIDDSEVARGMISRTLQAAGHTVFELVSAIGATRLVTAKLIHVVILDVQMPAMNGDRLAALFRRNSRFDRVGLVLVSDSAEDTLRALGESVGADAVLSKRQVESKLAEMVVRLAQKRAARPAPPAGGSTE
jgi:CheY-like chemotaxis protein